MIELQLHTGIIAALIFVLRVIDVSLGTVRTISLVNGRILTSVILGFFEILIWITVVSQVIGVVNEKPVLLLAYAAGFACGNAVGIIVEKKLAIGSQILHIFSVQKGPEIAAAIRQAGQTLTVFTGEGRDGQVRMLSISSPRKKISSLIAMAEAIDSTIFCTVESASGIRRRIDVSLAPTGWRAVFKKK